MEILNKMYIFTTNVNENSRHFFSLSPCLFSRLHMCNQCRWYQKCLHSTHGKILNDLCEKLFILISCFCMLFFISRRSSVGERREG